MTDPIERYYKMKYTYERKYINYKDSVIKSDLAKNKKKIKNKRI